jgi:hypothetical protein
MASKKKGFFATLFGWRRRRDAFELSVGSVIAKLVENNLGRVTGTPRPVSADRIEVDALVEELSQHGPGSMAVFIGSAYPPDLILIVPDAAALTLDAGKTAGGIPPLVGQASDHLADFLALTESPAAAHHRYLKKYAAADMEELSWRASGCISYRLSIGEETESGGAHAFYACVGEEAAARAEEALASDREYQEAVRAMFQARKEGAPAPGQGRPEAGDGPRRTNAALDAAAEPPQAAAPVRTVRIGSPREFLAGSVFLMPRIQCGKHVIESRFLSATLEVDRKACLASPGTWVLTTTDLGAKKWPVWYFFPGPEPGKPAQSRETIKGLAGCIFREALRTLSTTLNVRPEKPAIALDSKPDLAGQTGYLVLKTRVTVGAAAFACDVFVDYALLSPLLKAFVDPAEIASAPRGPFAVLPLLFCLNQSLFRRRLGSFQRDFTDAGAGEDALPFGIFLDLLSDHDCAVVLQNYALRAAGTRGLRRLFSYAESVQTPDGKTASRIFTPHAFDEERLLSFLPQNAREDWSVGKRDAAGSAAQYRQANREMLAGIHQAIKRKTLLVSPRALTVLEKMFMPGVRAKAKDELGRAAASGIPFATIKKLPKAQIQQFFGRQANRLLCIGLIGAENELAFVAANISKKRAAALAEDLEFVRSQHSRGLVETAEVLGAKQELERGVRKMMDDMAKQAAREKAKRGDEGEAGERARYKGWATGKKHGGEA